MSYLRDPIAATWGLTIQSNSRFKKRGGGGAFLA